MTNAVMDEERIDFPCHFPLKVMGLNQDDYPAFVLQVTQKHVQGISAADMHTRLSRNGKYIAVTITFDAQSREQLDALYRELNACERTRWTL